MKTRIDELKTEVLKDLKEPLRSDCEASFDRLVELNEGLIEIDKLSFGYTPVEVTITNLKIEFDIKKEISEVLDNIKQIFSSSSNVDTGILRSLESLNLKATIKQAQEKQTNESPKENRSSISSTARMVVDGLISKAKRAASPKVDPLDTENKKTKGRTTPTLRVNDEVVDSKKVHNQDQYSLDKNVAQEQEQIQKSPRRPGK